MKNENLFYILILSSLIQSIDKKSFKVTGNGFLDTTKIIKDLKISPVNQIIKNKKQLLESIENFKKGLGIIEKYLIDSNDKMIFKWLNKAKKLQLKL